MRYAFVHDTLSKLLAEGVVDREAPFLAVAAGEAEKRLFMELGFTKVTLSNLDVRMHADSYAPHAWRYGDAMNLPFEDDAFDMVFVSDGLHHCSSPHRALLEMYRVARLGVIVIESRDNFTMRLANWLNLSPEYELESVALEGLAFGGVNNTVIPNHIYRWTERDFEKTINTANPIGEHTFRYFYGLNLPFFHAKAKQSMAKYWIVKVLQPFVWLFTRLFKKQCNTFGLIALKPRIPEDVWPWLIVEDGEITINAPYMRKHFRVPEASLANAEEVK